MTRLPAMEIFSRAVVPRYVALALAIACAFTGTTILSPRPARADQATDRARSHYETGLELFYAREHAQALVEFQRAHEVKPRPATLFMMGQCEYFLGALRQARDNYEAYLRDSPSGEFVEVAKDRVQSINRRPATLVINTVPDEVEVRIVAAQPDGGIASAHPAGPTISGLAPNNFTVPRGRWAVGVSKANYQSQQLVVDLDIAETKPLFFKLEPIPARLEIETVPPNATLYLNGNRARNPYRQDVSPGPYEVFAEASDYDDRTQEFVLRPGQKRLMIGASSFRLRYVQRSGRPEILFAASMMGGLFGAGAIGSTVFEASALAPGSVATVSLLLGGAVVGTIGGALIGNRFVPAYIPDNRALFMIAGMWMGAAQGALLGMTIGHAVEPAGFDAMHPGLGPFNKPASASRKLYYAFYGSVPGLALGAAAGALMMNRAPTYGRVALIQSAVVGGAFAGGLTAVALRWSPFGWQQVRTDRKPDGSMGTSKLERVAEHSVMDLSLPALIGLNVGLAAGLLGAYLPDQSRYGPSWKRIALIDLAAGAGALAAGIGACIADDAGCLKDAPDSVSRAKTAAIALVGGVAGLAAGIVLTRNVDADSDGASAGGRLDAAPSTPPPTVSILPVPTGRGGVMPMLSAAGFF